MSHELQLLKQNQTQWIRSVYLKVTSEDFPLIPEHKTEVRQPSRGSGPKLRLRTPWPLPVWLWRETATGAPEGKLVVCEAVWQEMILAMTPESLAAEGFEHMDEFKRYWRLRSGKFVRPNQLVTAYRLSPFDKENGYAEWGFKFLDRLYGKVSG